ncbi:MAG TPA: hypothetical protein VK420_19875, partial [Longimicrobium sp.]|nr:hypothetical protein [Longimicrobium sp.]
RFRLAAAKAPDDIPIITPGRARELAHAFLRSWGHGSVQRWGWERGGTLNPDAVTSSSRVYFAQSPLGRIPDDLYHPAIRRMYGPMYIVPLQSGDEVVALLCISAYATDVEINTQGLVETPRLGGSYFFSKAVAPNPPNPRFRFVAVSPEEAVEHVAKRTGARATEVPELVLLPGYHPASAAWRVRLDRPVRVSRISLPSAAAAAQPAPTAAPFEVRELYVANDQILTVPSREQPSHKRISYPTGPGTSKGGEPSKVYDLLRRGDLPIVHEPVAFAEEGR